MGKLGEILSHPEEILPLAKMYYASKQACKLPSDPKLAFCYDILNSVSRSFAVVIQQLPNPLRDAICVFYLVLRGLDTVEDDMAIPEDTKVPDLLDFHKYIYQRGFNMSCGYGHYVRLMKEFDIVVDVFLSLEVGFQDVIADITRRMGAGMAEFIRADEVETVAQYDLYCHYVAGLVGIGLSQMFAASGLESSYFAKNESLSNHMGLFLQKTNIIRDYLEDIMEEPAPRMFWPRQIWGRYAPSLAAFKEPGNKQAAIRCLNHMVTDAMRHLPHCLQYMERLQHPDVFRFCAIPQLMAAGTLALCYNNGGVFEGVVKMRRGETARIFDEAHTMGDVYRWLLTFLRQLRTKASMEVHSKDPTVGDMKAELDEAIGLCQMGAAKLGPSSSGSFTTGERLMGMVLLLAAGAFFYRSWGLGDGVAGGAALIGSGPVIPAIPSGLEQYLALVLLVAAMMRVVVVRQ